MKLKEIYLSKNTIGQFLITELKLFIPNLPSSFEGYKVAQLTDLHFGSVTPISHIKNALKIVNSTNPDLILLTGDCIQLDGLGLHHFLATKVNPKRYRWVDYRRTVRRLTDQLHQELTKLSPKDGFLAVPGNHEHLEGISTIVRRLNGTVKWLINESVLISRNCDSIQFSGIDDLNRGDANLKESIASLNLANGNTPLLKILLSHTPDVIISKEANLVDNFDLIFSGHTHGGQICLPFWGPITTHTKQRKHVKGLSRHNQTNIYVSNGVGYGAIRLRLFCPPEIVILTLTNLEQQL